jgi:hypothetical protein
MPVAAFIAVDRFTAMPEGEKAFKGATRRSSAAARDRFIIVLLVAVYDEIERRERFDQAKQICVVGMSPSAPTGGAAALPELWA